MFSPGKSVFLFGPLIVLAILMAILGLKYLMGEIKSDIVVAFLGGKKGAGGVKSEGMTLDQWDYQHITTWNFLPFVLKRMGEAPKWTAEVVLGIWYAAIAALLVTLVKLRNILRHTAGSQSYFS